MEEILKSVAEAEAQAAEMKEIALKKAAEISATAEAHAAEIQKQSETECKQMREQALKAAQIQAQEDYLRALEVRRGEAEKYADGLLQNTESLVNNITRRICGDR